MISRGFRISRDKFVTDWAELVKLGDNLKTTSKMPDGNTRSQLKAVRHFGHPLAVLANAACIIFGRDALRFSRRLRLPVLPMLPAGHSVKAIGLLQLELHDIPPERTVPACSEIAAGVPGVSPNYAPAQFENLRPCHYGQIRI
jgi:hypothetical protein